MYYADQRPMDGGGVFINTQPDGSRMYHANQRPIDGNVPATRNQFLEEEIDRMDTTKKAPFGIENVVRSGYETMAGREGMLNWQPRMMNFSKTKWIQVDECGECGHKTHEEIDIVKNEQTGKTTKSELPCEMICTKRKEYKQKEKQRYVQFLYILFNDHFKHPMVFQLLSLSLDYLDMVYCPLGENEIITSSFCLTKLEWTDVWNLSIPLMDDTMSDQFMNALSVKKEKTFYLSSHCNCNWCTTPTLKGYIGQLNSVDCNTGYGLIYLMAVNNIRTREKLERAERQALLALTQSSFYDFL